MHGGDLHGGDRHGDGGWDRGQVGNTDGLGEVWGRRPTLMVRLAPALTTAGTVALVLAMFWLWQSGGAVDSGLDERLPFLDPDSATAEQTDDDGAPGTPSTESVFPDDSHRWNDGDRGDGNGTPAEVDSHSQPDPGSGSGPGSDPDPDHQQDGSETESDPGPDEPAEAATILVHVSGAVVAPGVVEVAEPARVFNAIEAAAGSRDDAELDRLNLAAPIVDGERIHVPAVGETATPELVETRRPDPVPGDPFVSQPAPERGPVDINVAPSAELESLPGIGPTIAAAIVELRDARGPYRSIDELLDVDGIGPAKLDELAGLVVIDEPPRP